MGCAWLIASIRAIDCLLDPTNDSLSSSRKGMLLESRLDSPESGVARSESAYIALQPGYNYILHSRITNR
jgi:hypothetical protein